MFQDRSTGPRPVCLIFIEDFCPKFRWIWNSFSGGDFCFKLCRPFCSFMGKSLWNLKLFLALQCLSYWPFQSSTSFVDLGLSLTYCRACVLQFCGHLMGKGWSLASPMCDVFLFFYHFSIRCPGSGVVLDLSIPDLCNLPHFGRGHY